MDLQEHAIQPLIAFQKCPMERDPEARLRRRDGFGELLHRGPLFLLSVLVCLSINSDLWKSMMTRFSSEFHTKILASDITVTDPKLANLYM